MRALIAVTLLALAACGSGKDSTTIGGNTFTNEKDGTATITNEKGSLTAIDGDAAAKTAMPAFAPKYPGATIVSVLKTNTGERKSTMVNMTSGDSGAKVLQFYRDSLVGAGFTIKSEMTFNDGGMLSAENSNGKVSLSVSRDEETGKSQFVVTLPQA
ncbi:hypothetical protein EJC47_20355 [Sphingomonas sp. TF3]|uniref:hypothetical protein n=1 Tax=Sphingomonas sp. TF3 TaxID=2495580 RepID=UPI000F871310|nr:hypothetical protein [Sphingomonas sp. TF3]RUN74665.1 hypothetical protein EJC47_20355 [Sphingomonas sp. TF3]